MSGRMLGAGVVIVIGAGMGFAGVVGVVDVGGNGGHCCDTSPYELD